MLIAVSVGAAAGLGVGAGVAATIRARNTTAIKFSPNTSVFRRMNNVQAVLARVLPSVVAIQASGPGCASGLQVHGPTTLRAVSFGDSSTIRVGEDVLAIGNALALSQSTPSVTEGIISAEGRSIKAGGDNCSGTESLSGLLQTQAPINPGNSGGPLVNSAGQVIGMNTAAATSTSGDAPTQNIGFAIPIANIRPLIPGLRKGGTVGTPKAFLGVEVVSVTPAERSSWGLTATSGALVVSVFPGAPATLAGIGAGDVIVRFAGRTITTDVSLTVAVRATRPGERVTVELYRGPTLVTISLVLGVKPAPEAGSS